MNERNDITDFFNQYAARVNWALWEGKFDTEGLMGCFSEDFIGASPLGVRVGKNDASFREAVSKGWTYYRDLGIHSMNIIDKRITQLNELHAMVKVKWQCLFVTNKGKAGEIGFDVFYILQMRASTIKIFAYITGDEQQAFREAGLISDLPSEQSASNFKES
jgi:hypothetical protein